MGNWHLGAGIGLCILYSFVIKQAASSNGREKRGVQNYIGVAGDFQTLKLQPRCSGEIIETTVVIFLVQMLVYRKTIVYYFFIY